MSIIGALATALGVDRYRHGAFRLSVDRNNLVRKLFRNAGQPGAEDWQQIHMGGSAIAPDQIGPEHLTPTLREQATGSAPAGHQHSLGDLTDVDLTTIPDGTVIVLALDLASGIWLPSVLEGGTVSPIRTLAKHSLDMAGQTLGDHSLSQVGRTLGDHSTGH